MQALIPKTTVVKAFAILLIAIYLFSPSYLAGHVKNMDSSMMKVTDCPYMNGGNSICPVSIMDYINTWKNTIFAILPSLLSLFTLITLFFSFYHLLQSPYIDKTTLYLKRKKYKDIFFLYKILFSRGILNSKAY